MSRSDKSIIAIALAPNLIFCLGLFGWMAWRMASGQAPFPHGATPYVMGLCAIVPMACVAVATFIRLRRDAA
ncbi:MAG TPA: hypothetical protein VHN39_13290 [Phenylobacterium sp.]|nr:hypothetical protein [Phenylobacterium sp.]